MSDDQPTPYVRALAEEYRRVTDAGQKEIASDVSEDLARYGWGVGEDGELVRVQERAVVEPASETPEKPAPKGK